MPAISPNSAPKTALQRSKTCCILLHACCLCYDDLTHYQKVVVVLSETLRIMAEADKAHPPAWPLP